MPNWCNNSITISGPVDKIRAIWEKVTFDPEDTEVGLLEAMVPIGEWDYGTAVDTWGTKWDVSSEGLEFSDCGDGTAEITGWFDSAWAPPVGAYERFTEANEDCSLEASYYEPGMDFGGFWRNGDDICFEDLQSLLEQPTDEWSEEFSAFEVEYDLLSEEWRFEEDEEEVVE